MMSKFNFWNGRHQKSRTSGRRAGGARRSRSFRNAILGLESLENRCLLAVTPVLSLESGQFFAVGGSFTPFRASFTDVHDGTNLAYDYTIDWGDGSAIESGNTERFQSGFALPGGEPPIFGVFDAFHGYASAGEYPVTVTLNDGTGIDTEQTVVNVYPRDNGLRFDGNFADVNEGESFEFSLIDTINEPFAPAPIIENISSWTINWGDSIEVISGTPSSVTHTYADDDNLDFDFPGARRITVAATGSNGTFFAFYSDSKQVVDVEAIITAEGAADVNEGETYVLNLSAVDPGDPVDGWIIIFGDEQVAEDLTFVAGNPPTVTHVYKDGDASYSIFAQAMSGNEAIGSGFVPVVNVHNVVPTLDDTAFAVPENSPNGTVVGTLPVVNPANDDLTFTVSGNEAGAFAVNPTTGEITVTNSALLDIATHPTFTLNVEVTDGEGGFDTANVTINVTRLANISGAVFVDVNHNGLFDANEPGIDGVTINLLNQSGIPVLDGGGDPITTLTSNGGLYLFEALQPGIYQVSEEQPTGVSDGGEQLGSLGGTIVANDRMQLTITGADAFDYAFAEFGQQLTSGDTAGVGFWHGKNGQALIAQGGTELAVWLTSHFGNIFGNTLVGMTGSQVASFYRDQVFKGVSKSGGTPKADANFMAVALATYFTSNTLAGQVAASYGFHVTDTGIGTNIVNVGTKGAAFSVANGSNRTIMQLLLATNNLTDQPNSTLGYVAIYDQNGDGAISSAESSLRSMAQDIFKSILDAGGV